VNVTWVAKRSKFLEAAPKRGALGSRTARDSVRPTTLPPYLPLASTVKPLQLSNFERQMLFLLATLQSIE